MSSKLRVLLDPEIFGLQKFGGVSRYYTELFRALKKEPIVDIMCPLFYSENLHLEHYQLSPRFFSRLLKVRGIKRLVSINGVIEKSKIRTFRLLKEKRADIFVPTYYNPYFLSALGKVPFVLTVYDMIHELFPQYFLYDSDTVGNKLLLMGKAKKIIAISENTKRDIIKLYPQIPADKIEVVYLNHSIQKSDQSKNPNVNSDGKYILFVGARTGYKNFVWFLKTVSSWLIQNDIHLVCLGGNAFNDDEISLVDILKIQRLVRHQNFKDHELASFYANALAFVFPSKYEGFGIPVLEAMACNCPVILPAVSSFPEVAANAGVYFQLENPTSLINALDKVLNDNSFRDEIIREGKMRVADFSWEKTVADCLKVFRSALV